MKRTYQDYAVVRRALYDIWDGCQGRSIWNLTAESQDEEHLKRVSFEQRQLASERGYQHYGQMLLTLDPDESAPRSLDVRQAKDAALAARGFIIFAAN